MIVSIPNRILRRLEKHGLMAIVVPIRGPIVFDDLVDAIDLRNRIDITPQTSGERLDDEHNRGIPDHLIIGVCAIGQHHLCGAPDLCRCRCHRKGT